MNDAVSRRQLILSAGAAVATIVPNSVTRVEAFALEQPLSAGEDLMQEHGVFGRLLLIYQALAVRFSQGKTDPANCLTLSTKLIVDYIQGHHERVEELLIFPALTRASREEQLVSALVRQHQVGKEITEVITKTPSRPTTNPRKSRLQLVSLLNSYCRMFWPHALREDTVVYPELHRLMTGNEYTEFSEKVRTFESKLLHNSDLKSILGQVDGIETALGIYDMTSFTAKL